MVVLFLPHFIYEPVLFLLDYMVNSRGSFSIEVVVCGCDGDIHWFCQMFFNAQFSELLSLGFCGVGSNDAFRSPALNTGPAGLY